MSDSGAIPLHCNYDLCEEESANGGSEWKTYKTTLKCQDGFHQLDEILENIRKNNKKINLGKQKYCFINIISLRQKNWKWPW